MSCRNKENKCCCSQQLIVACKLHTAVIFQQELSVLQLLDKFNMMRVCWFRVLLVSPIEIMERLSCSCAEQGNKLTQSVKTGTIFRNVSCGRNVELIQNSQNFMHNRNSSIFSLYRYKVSTQCVVTFCLKKKECGQS